MDYDYTYKKVNIGHRGLAMGYLHRKGRGKTIVFVHGIGTHSGSWTKLINLLPRTMNVYAIDLLGHGRSHTPRAFKISLQIKALEGFVSKLRLSDFYLYGHSYGGWLSLSYALKNGGVRGLILEDSSGLKSHFDEIKRKNAKERYIRTVMDNINGVKGVDQKVVRKTMETMFGDDHLTEETLKKMKCRTLIVWGAKDSRIPLRYGSMFHKHIKNSVFKVVKNAKHTPHYTHPEIVSELIKNFVEEWKRGLRKGFR
jgi:pimeloyl-ACP methyl ester carboxylesterase